MQLKRSNERTYYYWVTKKDTGHRYLVNLDVPERRHSPLATIIISIGILIVTFLYAIYK